MNGFSPEWMRRWLLGGQHVWKNICTVSICKASHRYEPACAFSGWQPKRLSSCIGCNCASSFHPANLLSFSLSALPLSYPDLAVSLSWALKSNWWSFCIFFVYHVESDSWNERSLPVRTADCFFLLDNLQKISFLQTSCDTQILRYHLYIKLVWKQVVCLHAALIWKRYCSCVFLPLTGVIVLIIIMKCNCSEGLRQLHVWEAAPFFHKSALVPSFRPKANMLLTARFMVFVKAAAFWWTIFETSSSAIFI